MSLTLVPDTRARSEAFRRVLIKLINVLLLVGRMA